MVKLCVSTLGCPAWGWDETVAAVKDFGYSGIEVRGVENELFVPNAKIFSPSHIEETKQRLAKLSLSIACLTSGCLLHQSDRDYVAEAKAYIDLASQLDCLYVRVLGDTNPEPGQDVDMDLVAAGLNELAAYGEDKGVMPLIETNGVFAKSETMLALMEKINSKNIGVVWDVHHPYRYFGEAPEYTYEKLRGYIKHVHVKDSALISGKVKYVVMGEGDVPVADCVRLLKSSGYKGFVSLEWAKRWYDDLSEPGIIFLQFAEYMKALDAKI